MNTSTVTTATEASQASQASQANNLVTFPKYEVFVDIEGYDGLYQIGDFGTVVSLSREKLSALGNSYYTQTKTMRQNTNKDGYVSVRLTDDYGDQKKYDIHRLVALNHLPNPEMKPEVNHIDGNKSNNTIDNLEWNTRAENVAHAVLNGLTAHSEGHPNSKLKVEDILYIRAAFKRGTKTTEELVGMFQVGRSQIGKIVRGERWAHVK